MAKARISAADGRAALGVALAPDAPRQATATAVRFLLQELADTAPGGTLEVRVPPFGAVQCVAGPKHTRGTPPNVVEMSAEVWLRLATGRLDWDAALADASVLASGSRATLAGLLPVLAAPAAAAQPGPSEDLRE